MRCEVFATDYDGTLAHHGVVSSTTIQALEKLKATGRRLLMVTGREVGDLQTVFGRLDLFDMVIAENGALLFTPGDNHLQRLHEPPPAAFAESLRARGVTPLWIGEVIVATVEPYEKVALEVIKDLGLELEIIFNKGSVMILPSGVNKATGLKSALKKMGISREKIVGVGDAENDHAFLNFCGCGIAVSNALPSLKERASYVTKNPHGEGVAELITLLIATDLQNVPPRPPSP